MNRQELELELLTAKIDVAKADVELRKAETVQQLRENETARISQYEARNYAFTDAVYADSCGECVEALSEWARRGDHPITIHFNCTGGLVFDGFGLYDYIRGLVKDGHDITTVGLGKVFSMGGILLQSGSRRVISPNSYMLIHEVQSGAIGKQSEIQDTAKLLERLQVRALRILAARSTMTEKQIKTRWKRQDWYLDAEEALELGFVDEIGER